MQISAIQCRTNTGELIEIPLTEFFESIYSGATSLPDGVIPKVKTKNFVASGVTTNDKGEVILSSYSNDKSVTGIPVGIIAFDGNGRLITMPLQQQSGGSPTSSSLGQEVTKGSSTPNVLPFFSDEFGTLSDTDILNDSGNYTFGGQQAFWKIDVQSGSVNIDQRSTTVSGVADGYRINGRLVVSYSPNINELVIGNTTYSIMRLNATEFYFKNGETHYFNIRDNGNTVIGSAPTTASYTNSRLFVYGGANGANIDVKGASGTFTDQALIELEGSDYDTSPNSVVLSYFGGTRGGANVVGLSPVKLGMLSFSSVNNILIRSTNIQPIQFSVDNVISGKFGTDGLTVNTIAAETTDVDKFLVSNAGLIKYRTGTELLSDIGAFATPVGLTTNYLPKWTGTAFTNSQIFDNGPNVGIGTASPLSRTHIYGDLTVGLGSSLGNPYSLSIISSGASNIPNKILYGTDGTGWAFSIGKNQAGTITDQMTFLDNGKVGIGITLPTEKLHVVGSILQTGFNTGLAYADATGKLVIATAAHVNTLVGVGLTTNYIPKWTGTAFANSQVFDNGTNVGIGQSSPTTLLHVGLGSAFTIPNGAGVNIVPQIVSSQTSGTSAIGVSIDNGVNNRRVGLFLNQTNSIWGLSSTYSSGAIEFVINDAGAERLRITSTGNVGIGTASPNRNLTVQGSSGATFANSNFVSGATGTSLGITFGATTGNTHVRLQTFIGGETGAGNLVLQSEGGNVGIGITLPTEKLHVVGSILQTGFNTGLAYADATGKLVIATAVHVNTLVGNSSLTTNYLPKWNGTSFANSQVFDNGTNVGIGTASPTYKLDVTGTGHFTGSVTFDTVPSSLQDATTANHLVRYSQWIASTSIKYLPTAVRTVSLINITLLGVQTINGVLLVAADRVLVMGQTLAYDNGVYIVAAGAWARATDSDTDAELRGYIISVSAGTYAGYKYINTNESTITIGTTSITYTEFSNIAEIDPVFVSWRDASRTANTFWVAPSGANGVPTWRAMVALDVPTLNQSTTGSAATLTTSRSIAISGDLVWTVDFNGSANVTAVGTLATVATAGTYRSVTINAKGLVTAGTNPTTIAGYGITDYNSLWDAQLATKTTANLTEGSNLYFTNARGIGAVLTGYISGAGTVAATDTILQAIQKLNGNVGAFTGTYVNLTSNVTGILPLANGGTGSATQNFVDLTTNQTIAGIKTFTNYATIEGIRIHKGGQDNNTYVGNGSGENSTGFRNTSLGYRALNSITSGQSNIGIGDEALKVLTIGNNNIAIGGSALFSNTGYTNIAIGSLSLYSNTANSNTAIGYAALFGNTTGGLNIAIGANAGSSITGGTSNSTSSSSIYIGVSTLSSVNNQTNQIVIGNTATSNGSNTVTIGNSSITANFFNGTLKYGTLLKPNNIAGTNLQVLSTSGTQDSWVTLTTSYISNLSSYTGFDVRYITANQTITLSGIVTGIGTTAITTAIADAALSIAKTSGLQTALDAKMPNYTGTVGQVLTWDALSGGVPNFMNLDHKPLKLNINEIAVGNEFGLLESRSEFKYLNSLMSIGNKTNTTKYTSFGMTSPTGEHGLIKVFGGGSLHLDGVGVKVNHLGNSTIFERVVTVDQNGYLSAKVLDASGNTAQGLDSVLSVSNLATNRSIILNSTTGVDILNLSFHRNSVDAGGLIHSPTYNSNAGAIGLYAKVNAVLELATDSGDILIIPGGSLRLGDLSTTRKVYINNTAYNLNDAGNFAAGGWNNQQGGLSPANGDAVILIWNSSKNCFVLNHVKTNAPGSYDVTKKYLTID